MVQTMTEGDGLKGLQPSARFKENKAKMKSSQEITEELMHSKLMTLY
jgi:hypothetical protein